MSLLAELERLLTEHASAGVLREHLLLLKTKADLLEAELKKYRDEQRTLREDVARLTAALAVAEDREAHAFARAEGALFRRLDTGGFERAVYCPRCRRSAGWFEGTGQFHCDPCRWASNFTDTDLPQILRGLA